MVDVCSTEDVPVGEGRAATVDGRRIAVFRAESDWYALDDACPHRGGPLSDGILADGCVTCPLHERRFNLGSGRILNDDGCDHVTAHRVEVRDDRVFVAVAGQPALREAA